MIRSEIPGNYDGKNIDIFAYPTTDVNIVTVFVQGLYGVYEPEDSKDKIFQLVDKIILNKLSHCVVYNSSRSIKFGSDFNFSDRKEAFKDKTFKQELDDLKDVLNWVLKNSNNVFSVSSNVLIFYVHGNSMGGTFAILLNEYFNKIKKISLCGSGCGTNGSSKPILSTIFSENTILDSIGNFEGDLFLLQGDQDDVVPPESGKKIIDYAKKARIIHHVVCGADHTFSKNFGIKSEEAKGKFVEEVFDFLAN